MPDKARTRGELQRELAERLDTVMREYAEKHNLSDEEMKSLVIGLLTTPKASEEHG